MLLAGIPGCGEDECVNDEDNWCKGNTVMYCDGYEPSTGSWYSTGHNEIVVDYSCAADETCFDWVNGDSSYARCVPNLYPECNGAEAILCEDNFLVTCGPRGRIVDYFYCYSVDQLCVSPDGGVAHCE